MRSEGFAPSQLRVLKGDFEYLRLDDWFNRAAPLVLGQPGIVLVDLDEGSNRVRIGVERATTATSVRSLLAGLNIPAAAVMVEQTEPIHFAANSAPADPPCARGAPDQFPRFPLHVGVQRKKEPGELLHYEFSLHYDPGRH